MYTHMYLHTYVCMFKFSILALLVCCIYPLECYCSVCVGTVFPIIYGIVYAGMFGLLVAISQTSLTSISCMYVCLYIHM